MEALLLFFTCFGVIAALILSILFGAINLAALGIAFIEYTKEDIKEKENSKTR